MKDKKQSQDESKGGPEISLYPYTSLAPSLKIADAVKERGGARSPVSKSSLAAHLKESEKSASFLQRIYSAKAFGLIVGRSDYSLTDGARRYYSPTSENDRSNALLEFLSTPSSFREIIRLFDGEQLPKRDILANIFSEKLKIPESWKDRAAGFFENSAQFVGVIDENRFLRFKAAQHAAALTSAPVHSQNPSVAAPVTTNEAPPPTVPKEFSDQEEHSLYLDKEKTKKFTINSPLFITQSEYERICAWIKVALIIEKEDGKPQ